MPAPTSVYITVDVECAEERLAGRRVLPAQGYDLRVWGRFENQRRALGIELCMTELEARGFSATFYVEPLGALCFGEDELERVCGTILERGHDVQLHLHPTQRAAYWHSRKESRLDDDIREYSLDEQATLIRDGIALLERAGVPRGTLRSFRAGNFGADDQVWSALSACGLVVSSNYNPGYFSRSCRMSPVEAGVDLFKTGVGDVWELPISNLRQPNGELRHLQLRAVSLREMIGALEQCSQLGIGHVCIVSHSFELFFVDDAKHARGHLDWMTLRRFTGLLDYLQQHADRFTVETIRELAARLDGEADYEPSRAEFPVASRGDYAWRMFEQGIKRASRALPWP